MPGLWSVHELNAQAVLVPIIRKDRNHLQLRTSDATSARLREEMCFIFISVHTR